VYLNQFLLLALLKLGADVDNALKAEEEEVLINNLKFHYVSVFNFTF
jgi:hypothetical protein